MLCTGFVLPAEKMGVKGESVVETQQKNKENEDRTSDKGKYFIIFAFCDIYFFASGILKMFLIFRMIFLWQWKTLTMWIYFQAICVFYFLYNGLF